MKPNPERLPTRQSGVTLVELMISLLLGLLIAIGLATLFSQNKRSFYQNEDLARLLEDGRYALETLATDIAMAGFYAELADPDWEVQDSLSTLTDCRRSDAMTALGIDSGTEPSPWMLVMFNRNAIVDGSGSVVASPSDNTIASWSALAVSNNATSGSALTDFPCLVEDLGIEEGSDVVAVKRVAGAPTPDADVVPGRIYVAKRGTDEGGLFFGANLPTKDVGDPLQNDWELQTKVYFVRNEEDDLTGDGQEEVVPMLCRMVLDPASAGDYRDECIAQGIERFQIQWGVDTDGDGDANAYVSELDHLLADDGVADPNDVVSARIHVLARSVRPDPTYTNTKTYRMGDMEPYTPNDNFYRRILSTTVVVRNVRGLNGLDF